MSREEKTGSGMIIRSAPVSLVRGHLPESRGRVAVDPMGVSSELDAQIRSMVWLEGIPSRFVFEAQAQ